jgi:hypothetical protein
MCCCCSLVTVEQHPWQQQQRHSQEQLGVDWHWLWRCVRACRRRRRCRTAAATSTNNVGGSAASVVTTNNILNAHYDDNVDHKRQWRRAALDERVWRRDWRRQFTEQLCALRRDSGSADVAELRCARDSAVDSLQCDRSANASLLGLDTELKLDAIVMKFFSLIKKRTQLVKKIELLVAVKF